MKTIDKDRNILKRLVESYGKEDVIKFVKKLNEARGFMYDIKKDRKADYDQVRQEFLDAADDYLAKLCELLGAEIVLKDESKIRWAAPGRYYFKYDGTDKISLWYAREVCDHIGMFYKEAHYIEVGYIYSKPEDLHDWLERIKPVIEKQLDLAHYEHFVDLVTSNPGQWTDGYGNNL